ncbi:MAG: hypothetical protein MK209_05685, partial [Planctomycetes bacterium]|nr:hypothetical protein [Planctomycetota bacterium]
MRFTLFLVLASSLLTCNHEPATNLDPNYSDFKTHPVLETWQQQTAGNALPTLTEEQIEEIRDLLDAISKGGRLAHSAKGQLQDWDTKELTSGLLSIVEDLKVDLGHKRAAYAWLRDTGTPGLLPRL